MTTSNFCLIDISNLLHRAANVLDKREGDLAGGAMHIAFESMKKVRSIFDIDHMVLAFDHRSWRKAVYEGYKARDKDDQEDRKEVTDAVFTAIDTMKTYFAEKTNATVLHAFGCEADDFIARWIQLHPTDRHLIISTDKDYKQLVAHNVELYNGVTKTLYNMDGVFFQDNFKLKSGEPFTNIRGDVWKIKCDKKGVPEKVEPEWELFMKIMLGDTSDKITRAAVPRTKSKDLRSAFENPTGIMMSNIMSAYREDLEGRPTVKEMFERNKLLIDLRDQPDEIKETLDSEILKAVERERVDDVAKNFLKFCRDNTLNVVGENARKYVPMFDAPYRK